MEKYTLSEYAEMIRKTKPYLQALEELVSDVNYGVVEVVLDVRAQQVEKMTVLNRKVWLRPKEGHTQSGFVAIEIEKIADK